MLPLLCPAGGLSPHSQFWALQGFFKKPAKCLFYGHPHNAYGFSKEQPKARRGGNYEELFIWVDSCLLLQMGLLFIMYPLLPGACLAPCSKCWFCFLLKPHHCGAAEHLFAVAISAFTPKLWDKAGDNEILPPFL